MRSNGSMCLSLGWQCPPDFCSSMTSCHSSKLTLVHHIVPQQALEVQLTSLLLPQLILLRAGFEFDHSCLCSSSHLLPALLLLKLTPAEYRPFLLSLAALGPAVPLAVALGAELAPALTSKQTCNTS